MTNLIFKKIAHFCNWRSKLKTQKEIIKFSLLNQNINRYLHDQLEFFKKIAHFCNWRSKLKTPKKKN